MPKRLVPLTVSLIAGLTFLPVLLAQTAPRTAVRMPRRGMPRSKRNGTTRRWKNPRTLRNNQLRRRAVTYREFGTEQTRAVASMPVHATVAPCYRPFQVSATLSARVDTSTIPESNLTKEMFGTHCLTRPWAKKRSRPINRRASESGRFLRR